MRFAMVAAVITIALLSSFGCSQIGGYKLTSASAAPERPLKVDTAADEQEKRENTERAQRENAERVEQARIKANIESVLQQDAKTPEGVQSVGEVVARMRDIDTSECPISFRSAYLAHIHAWEAMFEVEKSATAFKKEADSDSTLVESFIRGLLGDPLGKANELREAQTQLQRDYKDAHSAIRETFNHVEETAVLYGATLPK